MDLKIKDPVKLILTIAISHLAGVIGTIFTMPAIPSWYASLQKPFFSPPSWIFAPVWLALYTLMGISAYLIWINGLDRKEVKTALAIFGAQLVLNTLWSIVFFGMHSIFAGLLTIILLWILIALTIFEFYKISKTSAWLLIPYIFWVSFAAVLNYSLWAINY